MSDSILILHYTPPGVIGGVEHIIHQHVTLLRQRGFSVDVIAGRAGAPDAQVQVIPEIDVARPESIEIEAQLADGRVSEQFDRTRLRILDRLAPAVARADVVLAHNAFTLHFSLPLTAALWELAAGRSDGSVIAWCHDLAWTNPLYIPAMHQGYPWELLRIPAPNTRYVTVSRERKIELAYLWGGGEDRITVVPNGVDASEVLRLSSDGARLVERYGLFDRDIVLVLPVRITRRKNIELAITAVRCLKERGYDVRFLVSGPTAPHHPVRSRTYLGELKTLREDLGVTDEVIFLADDLGHTLDTRTVFELYAVADALLFPSAQEGFGLPILEAGLARLPAVISDIPIFHEVGGNDVWTFGLDAAPQRVADVIMQAVESGPSRLYRRVLREYRWEAILDGKLLPLLLPHIPSAAGIRP